MAARFSFSGQTSNVQRRDVALKWNQVGTQVCSVARTLAVIGDRWTLLLVREAFTGATRFEDFAEGMGASRPTVAKRLETLTRNGILRAVEYQTNPIRYDYILTEKGTALLPLILTIQAWGDQWMNDGSGPPAQLVHRTCGQPTRPELMCSSCGEPLGAEVAVEYREDSWAKARGTAPPP